MKRVKHLSKVFEIFLSLKIPFHLRDGLKDIWLLLQLAQLFVQHILLFFVSILFNLFVHFFAFIIFLSLSVSRCQLVVAKARSCLQPQMLPLELEPKFDWLGSHEFYRAATHPLITQLSKQEI